MTFDRRCQIVCVALLAAGCERYPEQPVFVYGQALHSEGAPRRDVTLHFDRREEVGESPDGSESPRGFAPYGAAVTQEDGTFTLELPARDAEQMTSTDLHRYRFRVSTPLDEKGQAACLSFTFNARDIELPSLRPWDVALAVEPGATGPRVTFASAPPAPEKPPSAKLPVFAGIEGDKPTSPTHPEPVLQLFSAGRVFWQELPGTSPWSPPAWLLEDFPAPEVQLRALSFGEWWFDPLWTEQSRVTFRLEWRSARQPLPGGALLPLSRGVSCEPWWKSGVCPWTDGQLTSVPLDDKPNPTEVGVVLAAPARPSRAVIRGLQARARAFMAPTFIIVEGSEDGLAWRPLAKAPVPLPWLLQPMDPFAFRGMLWAEDCALDAPLVLQGAPLFLDLPLSSQTPVRQVRLSAVTGGGERIVLHSLAELSVFE